MSFSSESDFEWEDPLEEISEEFEEMSEETEEKLLFSGLSFNSKGKSEIQEYIKKLNWPKLKEELNLWGRKFSESQGAERIFATERILKLLEDNIFEFSFCDSDALAENANSILHIKFIGEQDHPIRFVKRIYPKKVFFDAVFYTLGYITSPNQSPERAAARAYHHDHEKGAQYVTYLTWMLEYFSRRRREELTRLHKKNKQLFPRVVSQDASFEAQNTVEKEVAERSESARETEAIVSLAALCFDKMQLDQMLVIGDGAIGKVKKVSGKNLQLFYSFRLVNFTRFAIAKVSENEDRILMRAAEHGFLSFSTEITEFCYSNLVKAALSPYIIEKKLYSLEDGKKVLQQSAVADYLKIDPGTLSPQFQAAARYLATHWKYKRP